MLTGLRKTSTLSPEPLIFWLQLSHYNISKVEMQKLHPPSPSHEMAARWLRLRYTIRPDPHATGFNIRMTNKHLDGRWRGFWKPHSLPSMVHTLHFYFCFSSICKTTQNHWLHRMTPCLHCLTIGPFSNAHVREIC